MIIIYIIIYIILAKSDIIIINEWEGGLFVEMASASAFSNDIFGARLGISIVFPFT